MNRFHIHLNVTDLDNSIQFYSGLFATPPAVAKPDYAKWMLDDPQLNFAISTTGRVPGIDHLGFQVEGTDGLAAMVRRLDAAGTRVVPEDATICCYAQSDKLWTEDPQGVRWETFHTTGEATTYFAGEAACALDGKACSPDTLPASGQTAAASCCTTASGCC